MTIEQLKEIAYHAANRTAPTNFSLTQVESAWIDGLKELCGSYTQFMKNRYDIYEIMIDTVDRILPSKTLETLGMFAEIKTVPQGTTAIFKRKYNKNRALKFLTQVGLSGVYETFRLDTEVLNIRAHAVGGAVTVDFERMLDGAESLAEVMDIMVEGMNDAVYCEVHKALTAAINATERPSVNMVSKNTFVAADMLGLINVVRSYGTEAVIFATDAFVAAMGPDAVVPAITGAAQGIYHPEDIDAIHRTGFINMFRGVPIIRMPNHYIDDTNSGKYISDQFAYIFPTGGEKVVKIVLEGQTQIYDRDNRDQSMEINMYKKMGVGLMTHNQWCIYQNTSLPAGVNRLGTEIF